MDSRYQNFAAYRPDLIPSLPGKCRPFVRYRQEAFGYLAAFPNGQVGMYQNSVLPHLKAGQSYAHCRPHLLTEIHLPLNFHFSAPLLGWIEITRKCNLRCPHCFVEGGPVRRNEISTERIKELLLEWAAAGVFSVVITGGEPSLHPDFVEIVHFAHGLGFTVGIATNGLTMKKELLERLPQDDVIISMSLDGAHATGKTDQSEFERVTQRLLEIKAAGFNTSIMTTTTRENARDLQGIIQWAINHEVSLRSVPFVPMGRGAQNRQMQNATEDVELAARFWVAEEEWERIKDQDLGLCTGKVYNFLLTMVFASRRCMSGRGLCYIDSSGDVYPCTTCSGGRTLMGGNIQMRDFMDIWEDNDWGIRQITWDNFRDTCEGCPISDEKFFCTGRCPGSSSVHHGRLDGCGMSPFQLESVLRREELFRQQIKPEPRVVIRPEPQTETV